MRTGNIELAIVFCTSVRSAGEECHERWPSFDRHWADSLDEKDTGIAVSISSFFLVLVLSTIHAIRSLSR